MAWKLGQDSFTVCRVKWIDGKKGTFFSYDWVHRFSKHRDREKGIRGLRKLIADWGARAEIAGIFENDGKKTKPFEYYEHGTKIY